MAVILAAIVHGLKATSNPNKNAVKRGNSFETIMEFKNPDIKFICLEYPVFSLPNLS